MLILAFIKIKSCIYYSIII